MELVSPFTYLLHTKYFSIGGGTPNILHEKELEDILKTARNFMNFKKDAVMSIELFPDESVGDSKLQLLKDYGINRISLGIQSFDNKVKKIAIGLIPPGRISGFMIRLEIWGLTI